MKKTLFSALVLSCISAHPEPPRAMEPVMQISAKQTAWLLEDETVMIVSANEASKLLGDDPDFVLNQINNMPATAAGKSDILYIDPDAANSLLGYDTP